MLVFVLERNQTHQTYTSAFAFDNIPDVAKRCELLRRLSRLLNRDARIMLLGSTPDIYRHEWGVVYNKGFHLRLETKVGCMLTPFPSHRIVRPYAEV